MRIRTKFGGMAAGVVMSVGAMTGGQAAECPDAKLMPSFELWALQTEFMVAALNCGLADQYNGFVRAYRDELAKADKSVGKFFESIHGSKGKRAHDTYKTKLANDAFLRNVPRFAQFCTESREAMTKMASAKADDDAFVTLVSAQPASHEHGMDHCARAAGSGSDSTSVEVAPRN